MLPTVTLHTNTGDIYDHYIVNSGMWRDVKGVKSFRFHLVWCRRSGKQFSVIKKNLNKYVITIWPSNGPLGIYHREMIFYTHTKTCREAGCDSPKLKITEMSNGEQVMEPGVRTERKTLPEAERNGLWGCEQQGWLSKAPCGVRAALKTLRTARGPARGSLQMTEAGAWRRDQWLSVDRNGERVRATP